LAVNFWGIPQHGYMACAWGGVAGYGTAMVLSYIVGQKLNPIPYPIGTMLGYTAVTAVLYQAMTRIPAEYPMWQHLAISTVLIACFAVVVCLKESKRKRTA
jgi:ABC-type lipoprotein release transport system permease subunit